MLRQHSWLWLTGYAFLYLLRPTCHPFPIGFRAPLRFRGPKSMRASASLQAIFRAPSDQAAVRRSPKVPTAVPVPAWVVFHARITSGRSSASTSKFGMKPRPTLGSLSHFGKLCLSGLRVLRDSDERVYSLHNPDTFDAGSGERHDSANRNGNMDASSQGIRNDGFRTLCPSRRTHRQNKNGEPSQNAVHNISLSVRTSVSASSSSRCIYSASKPSESVFAIANWTRPCRSTSITKE